MTTEPAILKQFRDAFDRDRGAHVQPWMVSWEYQDRNNRAGIKYTDALPQNFYTYRGPEDLLSWLNWGLESKFPDYFDEAVIDPLCRLSRGRDSEILQSLDLNYDMSVYDRTFGRYNAQDFLFQNLYPVPARQSVHRVLDFGAGFGRQSNLWTQKVPDVTYVGMDGIPLSYCLQNLYYRGMQRPFREYVEAPERFSISAEPGIFHLPTWRMDLLPTHFFDLVLCVQVLPEINETLLKAMLETFDRILKPGGAIYIRDHDLEWKPANGCDVNALLTARGFELEFRPRVIDREEIHGVPRIWRKPLVPKTDVSAASHSTASHTTGAILKHWVAKVDQSMGGCLTGLYRSTKKWRGKSGS